jgi:hypothetical protein
MNNKRKMKKKKINKEMWAHREYSFFTHSFIPWMFFEHLYTCQVLGKIQRHTNLKSQGFQRFLRRMIYKEIVILEC